MSKKEIKDDLKCPSLENYLDGNAINIGGETYKGLGAKSMQIIISSLSKLKWLHFSNGFKLQNIYISF